MIALPLPIFIVTLAVLCLATWLGATRFERLRAEAGGLRQEFNVIQSATLTLLGLIVGFTFSMALDRYEQRKDFEAAEANAILTAFQRADLLPASDAARLRSLLRSYLDQRVRYFGARWPHEVDAAIAATATLQGQLWSTVTRPALANPNSVTALAVEGVNRVVESQGDTQASWSNRIPATAWMMMGAIAIFSTVLVGVGLRKGTGFSHMLAVLPLVIAIAFFLIADIESPRMGIIRVMPKNLVDLVETLRVP
jgi:hypothetical protein